MHRKMYAARIERVANVHARITSLNNGIFSDAVLVLYADRRLERRAYQIRTSAPIFASP